MKLHLDRWTSQSHLHFLEYSSRILLILFGWGWKIWCFTASPDFWIYSLCLTRTSQQSPLLDKFLISTTQLWHQRLQLSVSGMFQEVKNMEVEKSGVLSSGRSIDSDPHKYCYVPPMSKYVNPSYPSHRNLQKIQAPLLPSWYPWQLENVQMTNSWPIWCTIIVGIRDSDAKHMWTDLVISSFQIIAVGIGGV